MSRTVQTPQGTFTGIETDGVVQFKGVPFGTITGRFKAPRITDYLGEVDCTKQGAICPQDELFSDSILGVNPIDVRPLEFNVNELECLNLLITAPAHLAEVVPVVVWIHGGANRMGTAYRGAYDPFKLVKRSIEISKPVIVVHLQFRIHVFGFMLFQGVGNFGLMDQKLGIEWVHKYIKYWGGDESRLSVFGQSSGSLCAFVQSCLPDKLFKQAAFLSGALEKFRSIPIEQAQKITQRLCDILQCSEQDLETLPWQQLVAALKEAKIGVLVPVDDGVFLPKGGYDVTPSLDAALFSDCDRDASFVGDSVPEGKLVQRANSLLPGYTRFNTNEDVWRFITAHIFFKGNYITAKQLEHKGSSIFLQCFDATNPIKPELRAGHMFELLYAMEPYKILPQYRELADQVKDLWTQFVYFKAPWKTSEFMLIRDTALPKSLDQLPDYRDFTVLDAKVDDIAMSKMFDEA